MKVTKEDTIRTAALARLRLSPEELEVMAEQLNRIFEYVSQLHEVDTSGVEPLHHVLDMYNVLDKDEIQPGLSREEALRNAPDRTEEFFRLPRVIN